MSGHLPASPDTGRRNASRKGAAVAGFIAVTVGLSGFFMGMRHTEVAVTSREAAWTSTPPPPEAVTAHPVAPRYGDIPSGVLRANRAWANSIDQLAPQAVPAGVLQSEVDRVAVRVRFASRRMYDGAPPVAPHPLDQLTPAACLSCHGQPRVVDGLLVPQMSHAHLEHCLQCHVSSAGPTSTWRGRDLALSLALGNRFEGRAAPLSGARAYVGAPPVIPHATWMRESCLSCHGAGGSSALRTSHPERAACVQCHAPSAAYDQVPLAASLLPPPLPGAQ